MKNKTLIIISGIILLVGILAIFINLIPQETITFTELPPVYLKGVVIP